MVSDAPGQQAPFEADKLRKQPPPLLRLLLDDPRWAYSLFRWLWPIARLGPRYVYVTQAEDVREVMSNHAVFHVPYTNKIKELTGANFMLGMNGGKEYDENLKYAMQAFRLADVPDQARAAAADAESRVASAPREIDAMSGLVTPILVDICRRYYGVPIDDPEFGLWAMAASNYLFNAFVPGEFPFNILKLPPSKDAEIQGKIGAARLRAAVDRAIAADPNGSNSDTVLARLLAARARSGNGIPDIATIRAIIVSLITATVPTGTLAAGNILEMLLRREDMLEEARRAAAVNDELLSRCLFEALRFKPAGQCWRREVKVKDGFVLAADTRREKRIRAGTHVLASTHSAMFDPRQVERPNEFDPSRPAADYLLFGYGLHHCLGAGFASAIIPAIFKPLLLCPGLARRSERKFFGIFPEHFVVTIR